MMGVCKHAGWSLEITLHVLIMDHIAALRVIVHNSYILGQSCKPCNRRALTDVTGLSLHHLLIAWGWMIESRLSAGPRDMASKGPI